MPDQSSDPDFVPISPNPFIVGNPVRDRSMFFGRSAEFELVRKRFQSSPHGGLIVFCGERRSGKTSILFQIMDGRLGQGFIPVLVDMQSMAVASELEFFSRIASEIAGAMKDSGFAIEPLDLGTASRPSVAFQMYMEHLLRGFPDSKPILLFDEYELFESKIDAGILTEDVLNTLSFLMEKHPVFLIFTGSQHLEQRKGEYWKILPKSIYRTISYLQKPDALDLIRRPVEGRVKYDDDVVETIYRLTAGQPFYTQAICQSTVDSLNEHRTNRASVEILSEVTDGIIENPLPQMIFLWDSLDQEEKLVLSLLAETLAGPEEFGKAHDLYLRKEHVRYRFDLSEHRMASTLEALFKKELLLKDKGNPAGYAFRMDLWRLWIRRMHSVWQVMREEGLDIVRAAQEKRRRLAYFFGSSGLFLIALVLILLKMGILGHRGSDRPGSDRTVGSNATLLQVQVVPKTSSIYLDGTLVGSGIFEGRVASGKAHSIRMAAPGYADTSITPNLQQGDTVALAVVLRVLRGSVRVTTAPPGAEVLIDGASFGPSPVTATRLAVPESHVAQAASRGHKPVRLAFTVRADTMMTLAIALPVATRSVLVNSMPPGATLDLDGNPLGPSPINVDSLSLGSHGVRASLKGYLTRDTLLEVSEATTAIQISLRKEPPGNLTLQGDKPATMYIDGILRMEHVPHFTDRNVDPGPHTIKIVLVSGEEITDSVRVISGATVTYDYSTRKATTTTKEEHSDQ